MAKLSRRSLAKYAADQLVAGVSAKDIAKHLAAVLVETRRAAEAEFLASDIAWELEHRGLLAKATVISATPLSDELRRSVKRQIKKATKTDDVTLESQIDKSLIGGLRVETSTRIWDNTVRSKLTSLKDTV
jgi:F-type H+-transporting ATPase subunit delta